MIGTSYFTFVIIICMICILASLAELDCSLTFWLPRLCINDASVAKGGQREAFAAPGLGYVDIPNAQIRKVNFDSPESRHDFHMRC
jgi:hypothetical protein